MPAPTWAKRRTPRQATGRNFPSSKAPDMHRVNIIAGLLAQGATTEPWGSDGRIAITLHGKHVATTEKATVAAARKQAQGELGDERPFAEAAE